MLTGFGRTAPDPAAVDCPQVNPAGTSREISFEVSQRHAMLRCDETIVVKCSSELSER